MKEYMQSYLYTNIPLSKAMEIAVETATPARVVLSAPLAPNINHKRTVFGGSLHAAATLACWTLLYIRIHDVGIRGSDLVIANSEVTFITPVEGAFTAEAAEPEQSVWQRFLKTLQAKQKARIKLEASITFRGKKCLSYQATFAAIKIRSEPKDFHT